MIEIVKPRKQLIAMRFLPVRQAFIYEGAVYIKIAGVKNEALRVHDCEVIRFNCGGNSLVKPVSSKLTWDLYGDSTYPEYLEGK